MKAFKTQEMSWEEGMTEAQNYPFALVYLLSDVRFGPTQSVLEHMPWEECTEARFFDETGELHLFDYNGSKKAVRITDGEGERILRSYTLGGRFCKYGNGLDVVEYLEPDIDGQMVTVMTRLSGVRKMGKEG